jgi:hypothetical protein
VAAADEERTTRWSGGRDTGRRPDTAEYGTEAFQDRDRDVEEAGYEGTLRARGPVERGGGGPARGGSVRGDAAHGRAADHAPETPERAPEHPVNRENGAPEDTDAADDWEN